MCPCACILSHKNFYINIDGTAPEGGKKLSQEIKMTKWDKERALESESDLALTSFMTLSKIFNSSLYSSIKMGVEGFMGAPCPD